MSKDTTTEIEFEAQYEIRAGQPVVIVTKTTTVTPISGRGREWDKATRTREATVFTANQARKMAAAINEAFFHAAESLRPDAHPHDKNAYENVPGPTVILRTVENEELGRFWSYVEAEAAGERLVASGAHDFLGITHEGNDYNVGSVRRDKKTGVVLTS